MFGSFFDKSGWDREFKINKLSAIVADRMIMPLQCAVISGTVRAERDFAYQSLILQIAK
jgi:hypothetical protein